MPSQKIEQHVCLLIKLYELKTCFGFVIYVLRGFFPVCGLPLISFTTDSEVLTDRRPLSSQSPASLVYCLCDFSPLKDTLTHSRSQTCFSMFPLGLAGWTFRVRPMVSPETGLHYSARGIGIHHRRLCFHCGFITVILT